MEEIWKDIIGYEGIYQVSNLGRVKSLITGFESYHPNKDRTKLTKYIQKIRQRILRTHMQRDGYILVGLSKNKKQTKYTVHRLVALSFINNPENKPQINHKNGVKHDNRVENLEWVTQSENSKHSFVIGLQCNKNEKHPMCKLSNEQVNDIRHIYSCGGWTHQKIADMFKVSKTQVGEIIRNKSRVI